MATEFARSQTIALSCVGAMLEHYQKFTPKAPNIAKLKTASSLLSTWNDLPLEFIEAIVPFQRRLYFRVLLQLVDILNTTFSLNTEMAADIHH